MDDPVATAPGSDTTPGGLRKTSVKER